MRWRRSPLLKWFRRSEVDLLGALAAQADKTVATVESLVDWAKGKPDASKQIVDREHEADAARRHLVDQVREIFVSPINPEDVFDLAERLDAVVNGARDLVREAEVLGVPPDPHLIGLAEHLLAATKAVAVALPLVTASPDEAWQSAEESIKQVRHVHKAYRHAMSELPRTADPLETTARQELYRRASGIGDTIRRVANRVEYTVLKES